MAMTNQTAELNIDQGDIFIHENGKTYLAIDVLDERIRAKRYNPQRDTVRGRAVMVKIEKVTEKVDCGDKQSCTCKDKSGPDEGAKRAREVKEDTVTPTSDLPISDSPVATRVINIPPETWEEAKEVANIRNGAVRDVIAEAMNGELFALISDLHEMGISGDIHTKRVRASLDERIIEMMHTGKNETGLPGVDILRLCLRRHLAKRGGTK